jgi:hypothetical protein
MGRKSNFIRKEKLDREEELSSDSKKLLDEWMQKNRIPGLWEEIEYYAATYSYIVKTSTL